MSQSSLDQLRIDRKDEPRSVSPWFVLIPLILLLCGAGLWFYWFATDGPVEVKTVAARELKSGQSAGAVLNSSGYVTARRYATVSSKITGRVSDVLIEEGMSVEQGQILATLDDSNIRAAFNLAEAQLISARRGMDETSALLDEAQLNYDRSKQLVEKNLASEAELDRARALAGSLEARLERNRADVEVAARQVDIYHRHLDDTIIRAPFAGIVVAKNAQPGEMVSPVSAGGGFTRTGIGTIVDMSSLEIEIDVNEAYINRVKSGQGAVATLDAYPDWKIPAHVIAIIPTADRQRATVEVRVGFDELDDRILPDMGVKVAFHENSEQAAERPKTGILLPEAAVRKEGGRDIVFVSRNGLAERRAVAAAEFGNGTILIESGLEPGERVVLEGPPGLADGDEIQEKTE